MTADRPASVRAARWAAELAEMTTVAESLARWCDADGDADLAAEAVEMAATLHLAAMAGEVPAEVLAKLRALVPALEREREQAQGGGPNA
jgi:hypothetical protein